MRNKLFIFILLFIFAAGLGAQTPLLKEIEHNVSEYKSKIKKMFLVTNNYKKLGKKYKHILFIPFLYLRDVEFTQELIHSAEVGKVISGALKEQPTVNNLKTSVNFPHHAIIYDESLEVLTNSEGYFCVTPSHADALLKYYKTVNPQLVFYIWGLNDLFVLIDNRINRLVYDEVNNAFSNVEL